MFHLWCTHYGEASSVGVSFDRCVEVQANNRPHWKCDYIIYVAM